jgi:hypothetical protein
MELIIGRLLTSLNSSSTMGAPSGDDNSRGKVQNVLGDSSATLRWSLAARRRGVRRDIESQLPAQA